MQPLWSRNPSKSQMGNGGRFHMISLRFHLVFRSSGDDRAWLGDCRSKKPILARQNSRQGGVAMRLIWFMAAFCVSVSARAAQPPDSDGRFQDWFRALSVPGSPNTMCCTIADCRLVEARWNEHTQHYEAKVTRERFSNALGQPVLSHEDDEAFQAARSAWMKHWITKYGDNPGVWIEVPQAKVNPVQNPTGHAVLCWSVFNSESNGVYCFVPFVAAENKFGDRPEAHA
jgi:hypothetical protein